MEGTIDLTVNHDEYKSFIENIIWEDIENHLYLPLTYQFLFDKKTSPMEQKEWNEEMLEAFFIDTSQIDRLYHLCWNDAIPNFRRWELSCRMKYKNEFFFICMYSSCMFIGPDAEGYGFIGFTKNPKFFLEHMITMDQDIDKIYQALKDDDYDVELPKSQYKKKTAPMLTELCHQAIYNNKEKLIDYLNKLPNILATSVKTFIEMKEWEREYLISILR